MVEKLETRGPQPLNPVPNCVVAITRVIEITGSFASTTVAVDSEVAFINIPFVFASLCANRSANVHPLLRALYDICFTSKE